MKTARVHAVLCYGVVGLALVGAFGSAVLTSELRTVRIEDKCDPASFNEAVGPGTCVGDENVTFAEFIEELMDKGEHGAWRFNPDRFEMKRSESINSVNDGGEVHTFTRVARFGGGFVTDLNELSGAGAPVPECAIPPQAGPFVAPGQATVPQVLPAGRHRFQCCIHPWMRTEVTVRSR